MTSRVYVTDDFARHGVAIYVVEQRHDGTTALGLPAELTMQTLDDEAATAATHQPTLRLPHDMARALLDALAAHFGGVSEVQTLRRDYMAERVRVDKLIEHLAARVVEKPKSPPVDKDWIRMEADQ